MDAGAEQTGQTGQTGPADLAGPPIVEIVVTAASADWLAGLARDLVERRLAACGQVIPSIRSVYRWEGAVQEESEARLALHTRSSLVAAVTRETHQAHPYAVPCVLALHITDASPGYVAWVLEQTDPPV